MPDNTGNLIVRHSQNDSTSNLWLYTQVQQVPQVGVAVTTGRHAK